MAMKGSSLKRKLINAERVFGSGGHSFLRNAWLSTAATIVMTITLLSILLTIFASITSSSTIKSFTDRIDTSIFFLPGISKQRIDQISAEFRGNQALFIREVTYISTDQAKASYEAANQGSVKDLQAIAQVDAAVAFPASLRIKTTDTRYLTEVTEFAKKDEFKDAIDPRSFKSNDKRTAVNRLGSIATFLRNGGLVASVVFGAISILVILNTIRMTIFNRKDEIEIMRLIGASKWYIRGPFLVEAGIYGLIAGIFASLFFFLVVLGQAPKLGDYVEEVRPTIVQFQNNGWLIIPVTILTGILIGSFSSFLAIRRHLKLKHLK